MKMVLGATPRPGKVPEQEQSGPRNLSVMAAELCIVFGKIFWGLGFFSSGMILQASEAAEWCPTGQGRVLAVGGPWAAARGRLWPVWAPRSCPLGSGLLLFNKKSS